MAKILIDVREPDEYNTGHALGALNIPVASISKDNKDISGLSPDQEIVVYCRSGGRAENARSKLLQLGFTNVVNGINQDQLEHNS